MELVLVPVPVEAVIIIPVQAAQVLIIPTKSVTKVVIIPAQVARIDSVPAPQAVGKITHNLDIFRGFFHNTRYNDTRYNDTAYNDTRSEDDDSSPEYVVSESWILVLVSVIIAACCLMECNARKCAQSHRTELSERKDPLLGVIPPLPLPTIQGDTCNQNTVMVPPVRNSLIHYPVRNSIVLPRTMDQGRTQVSVISPVCV